MQVHIILQYTDIPYLITTVHIRFFGFQTEYAFQFLDDIASIEYAICEILMYSSEERVSL